MTEDKKAQLQLKLTTLENEIQIASEEIFLLVKEDEKRSELLNRTTERLTKMLAQVQRDLAVFTDERSALTSEELVTLRKIVDLLVDYDEQGDLLSPAEKIAKIDFLVNQSRIIRHRPIREPADQRG